MRDKSDANAHIRHALEVAEEQVEEIQEVKVGDVTHYLFEVEVFATRDAAEEMRARRIGVVARRFYQELPAALDVAHRAAFQSLRPRTGRAKVEEDDSLPASFLATGAPSAEGRNPGGRHRDGINRLGPLPSHTQTLVLAGDDTAAKLPRSSSSAAICQHPPQRAAMKNRRAGPMAPTIPSFQIADMAQGRDIIGEQAD